MDDELRFDVFTAGPDRVVRTATGISLIGAEALSGLDDREVFAHRIMHQGWCGSIPAWTGFRPVVIVEHKQLLRRDQMEFLLELVDG